MIEYKWYTAKQCDNLDKYSDNDELSALLKRARKASINCQPDDSVCLLALDKSNIAGRMLFTYGHVSKNGNILKVAAAQDLYTSDQYRGHGIGTNLIIKSLEIGMPCIYSGISGAAMPLYKKLGFSFIDNSPIYQLPIGLPAIIKEWRGRTYLQENEKETSINRLKSIKDIYKSKSVATTIGSKWQQLDAESAYKEMLKISKIHIRPYQIPWNVELINSAFKGENKKFHSVILKKASIKNDGKRYFLSIYRRTSQVRIPFTSRVITFADGHLNEIFPPPPDVDSALELIGAAVKIAKNNSLQNLSIYAMADSIKQACELLKLISYHNKSFSIKPVGISKEMATDIIEPENWWCRAMNENQIEEAI